MAEETTPFERTWKVLPGETPTDAIARAKAELPDITKELGVAIRARQQWWVSADSSLVQLRTRTRPRRDRDMPPAAAMVLDVEHFLAIGMPVADIPRRLGRRRDDIYIYLKRQGRLDLWERLSGKDAA